MKSPEQLQEYLRDQLLTAIEAKAAMYHDEEWRTGIAGAILEGKINTLNEIIDWLIEE